MFTVSITVNNVYLIEFHVYIYILLQKKKKLNYQMPNLITY